MQIAIIYDCGRTGRSLIAGLIKKFGEPTLHNDGDGEIIFATDDVRPILSDIYPYLGAVTPVIHVVMLADDKQDLVQFFSL